MDIVSYSELRPKMWIILGEKTGDHSACLMQILVTEGYRVSAKEWGDIASDHLEVCTWSVFSNKILFQNKIEHF